MKWLLYSFLLLGSSAYANQEVRVQGPDAYDIYSIDGSFDVQASTDIVWSVLTDYENMSKFLPSITSSTVRYKDAEYLFVQQTFVAKFLFFNHSADALFKTELVPKLEIITFRDILHTDFNRCVGYWSINVEGSGTVVRYKVQIIPSQNVPHWIIRRVSKSMAVTLLTQLREEIEKRSKGL